MVWAVLDKILWEELIQTFRISAMIEEKLEVVRIMEQEKIMVIWELEEVEQGLDHMVEVTVVVHMEVVEPMVGEDP